MKSNFKLLLLFFLVGLMSIGYAFEMPYSHSEVKLDSNKIKNFYRVDPEDGETLNKRTDCWFWYDEENIYMHAECEIDSTNFTVGTYAEKDAWANSDCLYLQINPDMENYYGYMYYFHPLESSSDCVRDRTLNTSSKWDSDYTYTSNFGANLWTIDAIIPLKDLRFYGDAPYNWTLNVARYFDKKKHIYKAPYLSDTMGLDYFLKSIPFTINKKINKPENYKIKAHYIKNYDMMSDKTSFDPENFGVDVNYELDNSTNVKLTLQPDFSDIPLDDAQDNSNNKYAPYLDENRYFFTEDVGAFGVGIDFFNSREIVAPRVGLKVTHTNQKLSYAYMSVLDDEHYYEDKEQGDWFNLATTQYNVGDVKFNSSLVTRSNNDYKNVAFEFIPEWNITKNQSLSLVYRGSVKKDSADDYFKESKTGNIIGVKYKGNYKQYNYSLKTFKISKDYYDDCGYKSTDNDENIVISDFGKYWVFNQDNFLKYLHSALHYQAEYSNYNDNKNYSIMNSYSFLFPERIVMELSGSYGKENREYLAFENQLTSKKVTNYHAKIHLSWMKYQFFNLGIYYIPYGKTLVYSLNNTYYYQQLLMSVTSTINSYVNLNFSGEYCKYDDIPENSKFDDEFFVGNSSVQIKMNNRCVFSGGASLLKQVNYSLDAFTGLYANLRYEFKKDCNFYVGWKCQQYGLDNKDGDILGLELYDYSRTTYAKIDYTF